MFRNFFVTILFAAFIVSGFALVARADDDQKKSDLSGTWKWTVPGRDGNEMEVTLKLKQDGAKLTGSITGFGGEESDISDGKVTDGEISFKVVRDFNGQQVITTYSGKLDGDNLKGKSETVFARNFDAKREKQ